MCHDLQNVSAALCRMCTALWYEFSVMIYDHVNVYDDHLSSDDEDGDL